jgi:hypothetical protein
VEARRGAVGWPRHNSQPKSNPRITVDGDAATRIADKRVMHFTPGEPGIQFTLDGCYVDDLVNAYRWWSVRLHER